MKKILIYSMLLMTSFAFAKEYPIRVDDPVINKELMNFVESSLSLLKKENPVSNIKNITDSINKIVVRILKEKLNFNDEDCADMQKLLATHQTQLINIVNSDTRTIEIRTNDERKLIAEAISEIFYNLCCMILNPNNITVYLKQIFSGLMKILSAVLADGKIDNQDLENFQGALSDILIGSEEKHEDSEAYGDQKALFKILRNNVDGDDLNEKNLIVAGLSQIFNSIIYSILNPSLIKEKLGAMLEGLLKIISAILADGKIDNQDVENITQALPEAIGASVGE